MCNLIIIFLLGVILLFKKAFKKYITLNSQYHIWYVFVLALFLPFVPCRLLNPAWLISKLQGILHSKTAAVMPGSSGSIPDGAVSTGLGLSDFAVSIEGSAIVTLSRIVCIIWVTGCAVTALYFVRSIYKIYIVKKSSYAVTAENEADLYALYVSCKKELNIKRNVPLYASCSISSPVSCGLMRPAVIIPQDMDILLKERDVRFIFLHELQHYKHKDALLNYLSCIFQIVYWMNPFIWYAFHIMQKDREIACDNSVIRTLGKEHAAEYGYTLIRYAEKLQKNAFLSPLSRLGGEKTVIMQRIREIADYRAETFSRKLKSICLLMMTVTFVYAISPFLTAHAFADNTYSFSSQNAEEKDLSAYFGGRKGSFVLYDMISDHYTIYNKELSTRRVSPESTFKIYSGLFALEEGVIFPDSSLRTWDGTNYAFDSWNRDQTLADAMQNSVNWYFQGLDRQSGYSALNARYREISYGNCDLSGGIDNYWAESSLKISPVEQVILLSDLLQNNWEYDVENIEAVKDALYISDTPMGKLYGKTGTGLSHGENVNGWFVGFLERDGRIWCFAANIQDDEDASGSAAADLTVNILNDIL